MSRDLSAPNLGSLSSKISERLRRAILDAEFGLGEALSEEKLATAFGVSRTPVRDALTLLQAQGLIDIKPQRGSFVFMPSVKDVAELGEFRNILEAQALRLSVVRKKDDTLMRLRKATDDMEEARNAGDYLSVAHADTDFHAAFVEHSGNKYLNAAYRVASGPFIAIRTHITLSMGDIRKRVISEHRAIIAAIEDGNIAKANSVLSTHISEALDYFENIFKQGLHNVRDCSGRSPYTSLSIDENIE